MTGELLKIECVGGPMCGLEISWPADQEIRTIGFHNGGINYVANYRLESETKAVFVKQLKADQ